MRISPSERRPGVEKAIPSSPSTESLLLSVLSESTELVVVCAHYYSTAEKETVVKSTETIAKTFGLNDVTWRRHANPWSVWTRMAAFPLLVLAVWSRDWIGWWSLVPLAVLIAWMWVNPRAFPPIDEPRSWASKGIYGEKMWAVDKPPEAAGHRVAMRLLIALAAVGAGLLVWGLVVLDVWPTVFGVTLIFLSQLWQIDRFVQIYSEREGSWTAKGDEARSPQEAQLIGNSKHDVEP